jgi:hypothetical protein
MMPVTDREDLPSPLPELWWVPPAELLAGLEAELSREVGPGHPLYGRRLRAAARCEGCDDTLVALEDTSGWALAHPTFSGRTEVPPWPQATIFEGFQGFLDYVAAHPH